MLLSGKAKRLKKHAFLNPEAVMIAALTVSLLLTGSSINYREEIDRTLLASKVEPSPEGKGTLQEISQFWMRIFLIFIRFLKTKCNWICYMLALEVC